MNRLLLVDDEANVVKALVRVMRLRLPKSVKVEGFDDPVRALSRLDVASFDVIVSDFRMPQMDGIAFLRLARERQPHAVRLILSASTETDTVMKAVNDVEVFRYLSKPWQEDELITHILSALSRAALVRQERGLADDMRVQRGDLTAQEAERRRLEELEPGITRVEWGPHGEVLMPDLNDETEGLPCAPAQRPDRH
jgi:two-component system probable response regulator PhcQ